MALDIFETYLVLFIDYITITRTETKLSNAVNTKSKQNKSFLSNDFYVFFSVQKIRQNTTVMPSNESRIYVGNLPPDIRTKDIEDLFYKYGKIVFIDMKNRRGPPFAFVGKKNFKPLAFLWIP